MTGLELRTHGVSCRRGTRTIVDGVELTVPAGSALALVGANGAGKTTLLHTLAGVRPPHTGRVEVDGRDLTSCTPRERARSVAMMGQEELPPAELTLAEVVALGRLPHRRPWSSGGADDHRIVTACLDQVGLADRAASSCTELSGGERHRVVLARTLAQAAPVMLLDEPTNHLDLAWRQRLLALLDGVEATVVAALHDLDLVLRHFDAVAVVHGGRIHAHGPPVEVLTPELLREVFDVDGDIVVHPRTGRPHLLVTAAASDTDTHTHTHTHTGRDHP